MNQSNAASSLSSHQVDSSASENLEPMLTDSHVEQESTINSDALTNSETSQVMMQNPSIPANELLGSANMIAPLSYETNYGFPWETNFVPNFTQQYTGVPPESHEPEFDNFYSELLMNSERETGFLCRYYVECLGPWYVFLLLL